MRKGESRAVAPRPVAAVRPEVPLDAPAPPPVGIDIAARTLAVAVLPAGGRPAPAWTAANAAAGGRERAARLEAEGCRPGSTRLVMEATGGSWVGAATALTAAGRAVSVVSPASARGDAKAAMRRAKTDAGDAAGLAEVQALQLPVRQRDDLGAPRTATTNRQHALAQLPAPPAEAQAPPAAVLAAVARLDAIKGGC